MSNNTYWELRKDPGFSNIDLPTLWWQTFWAAWLCDPGWFWSRVCTSILPSTFTLLQFYCLNSKCLYTVSCVIMDVIVWECYNSAYVATIFTWHVLLYLNKTLYKYSSEMYWKKLVTLAVVLLWTFSTSEINLTCHWLSEYTYLFCTCLMPYLLHCLIFLCFLQLGDLF